MSKLNFEQLRKHTEYKLRYELKDTESGDVVEFDIVPQMKDRTSFLELVSNKKVTPTQIVDWFTELALREDNPTPEEKQIFQDFCMAHYGEIQMQTMIGFKLSSKEDMDKRMKELEDKLIEKNLQ